MEKNNKHLDILFLLPDNATDLYNFRRITFKYKKVSVKSELTVVKTKDKKIFFMSKEEFHQKLKKTEDFEDTLSLLYSISKNEEGFFVFDAENFKDKLEISQLVNSFQANKKTKREGIVLKSNDFIQMGKVGYEILFVEDNINVYEKEKGFFKKKYLFENEGIISQKGLRFGVNLNTGSEGSRVSLRKKIDKIKKQIYNTKNSISENDLTESLKKDELFRKVKNNKTKVILLKRLLENNCITFCLVWLVKGEKCFFGRNKSSDIIETCEFVSKNHAYIQHSEDGEVRIFDTNSKFGTFKRLRTTSQSKEEFVIDRNLLLIKDNLPAFFSIK